jgi:hypothetical protein
MPLQLSLPFALVRPFPPRRVVGVLREPDCFDTYRLECDHCILTSAQGTPWPSHWRCQACADEDWCK